MSWAHSVLYAIPFAETWKELPLNMLGVLVCPTDPADRHELSPAQHHEPQPDFHAPVGSRRLSAGHLQCRWRIQYRFDGAASDPDDFESYHVGAVSVLLSGTHWRVNSTEEVHLNIDTLQRWSVRKILLYIVPVVLGLAAIEVALILLLRLALKHHISWPLNVVGALAGALLCAGVAREYYEIYKHKTVEGISFFFCGIDAAGDLFSILSVGESHW